MKIHVLRIYTALLVGCFFLLNAIPATASGDGMSMPPLQERYLIDVLEELSDKHEVFFTYDASLLKDIKVEFSMDDDSHNLDHIIQNLLDPQNLSYENLGNRFYVIYKKGSEGKRMTKKLKRKFKQIYKLEKQGMSLKREKRNKNKDDKIRGIVEAANVLKNKTADKTITGTVTDENGTPLIGATVLVEGTVIGTVTDVNGFFSIDVPDDATTLVISYIGYLSQTVSIDSKTLDIRLQTDFLQLDEVVVTGTGYGLRKKENTTPVASISSAEIDAAPVSSIDGLLQGRVTGLRVNLNSGIPGSGSRILSRGVVSTFGSTTPVIYIDGVRVDNSVSNTLTLGDGASFSSALADLTTEDIERVEIIKAGAASTLFGSDAGNGVIQIFTKRGKIGQNRITIRSEAGIDQPVTRWYSTRFLEEEIFNSGFAMKNSINMQGGAEKGTYYVSLNQKENSGIFDNLDQSTYSFQGGVRGYFTDQFWVDASFSYLHDNYGKTYSSFGSFGNGFLAAIESGFWGVNFQDDIYDDPAALDLARSTFDSYLNGNNIRQNVNRSTASVSVNYRPYDFLDNKLTVGVSYRNSEARETVPVGSNPVIFGASANGRVASSQRESTILTFDYSSSLILRPTNNITSTLTGGLQGFREETNQTLRIGTEFGISGAEDIDAATNQSIDEERIELFNGGFYLNEQLGINDKVFVSLGARYDYNSSFGDDIGAQFYPKTGIAYSVSDEMFWKDSPVAGFWNFLKLRASWGRSGKFPDPFSKDRTFSTGPFLGQSAALFGNAGNENLGPEVTESTDIGFDAAFLNHRLSLEFSYYSDRTFDAILRAPINPVTGYVSQLINLGEIENKGIELSLNASIINTPSLKWDLGVNYATVNNKVVDMGGVATFSIGDFGSSLVMEGFPVGILSTNRPSPELDGTFETVFEKSIIPDKNGSIHTSLTLFNAFTLSANADWQAGGYFANTASTWQYFFAGKLQDNVPEGYGWFTATDNFKDKSDYLTIREIYMNYLFGDIGNFKNLNVFLSIRNVHTFHAVKYENQNPETLQSFRDGTDLGSGAGFTISPPRQFRFGFKVSF